jgi:hypothetical protein
VDLLEEVLDVLVLDVEVGVEAHGFGGVLAGDADLVRGWGTAVGEGLRSRISSLLHFVLFF